MKKTTETKELNSGINSGISIFGIGFAILFVVYIVGQFAFNI